MSTANVFLKKTWDSCIIPHHEPHVPQGSEGGKNFRMLPTIAINFLAYGNPLQITWNNLKGDSSSMTNHFMNESFVSFVSFISKSSGFPQKNPSISCASCSTSDHRSAGISALMPSRPSSSVAICHPILLTWMMWLQASWWFQPSWKISVKMGIFPNRDENKKYLKPPPSKGLEVIRRELQKFWSDFVQWFCSGENHVIRWIFNNQKIRHVNSTMSIPSSFWTGGRVLKSRKNSGCFFGRICKAVVLLCDINYIGSWKPQTTNLKWMEMVKQPFKTACLEFQVLIFFRPSYTSSHTSCKKTYTEKKYQIWCQYFRSNHEKGFLEPFQVRIAHQTWGQMIRIFQVWNVNGRRWSNRPINIWKCRSFTPLTKLLMWNST